MPIPTISPRHAPTMVHSVLMAVMLGIGPAIAQPANTAPPVKLVEMIGQRYPVEHLVDALVAPGVGATSVTRIRPGFEVEVLGLADGNQWYQIRLPDQRIAYVPVSAVPAAVGPVAVAPARPSAPEEKSAGATKPNAPAQIGETTQAASQPWYARWWGGDAGSSSDQLGETFAADSSVATCGADASGTSAQSGADPSTPEGALMAFGKAFESCNIDRMRPLVVAGSEGRLQFMRLLLAFGHAEFQLAAAYTKVFDPAHQDKDKGFLSEFASAPFGAFVGGMSLLPMPPDGDGSVKDEIKKLYNNNNINKIDDIIKKQYKNYNINNVPDSFWFSIIPEKIEFLDVDESEKRIIGYGIFGYGLVLRKENSTWKVDVQSCMFCLSGGAPGHMAIFLPFVGIDMTWAVINGELTNDPEELLIAKNIIYKEIDIIDNFRNEIISGKYQTKEQVKSHLEELVYTVLEVGADLIGRKFTKTGTSTMPIGNPILGKWHSAENGHWYVEYDRKTSTLSGSKEQVNYEIIDDHTVRYKIKSDKLGVVCYFSDQNHMLCPREVTQAVRAASNGFYERIQPPPDAGSSTGDKAPRP